jgi:hypothetical protein
MVFLDGIIVNQTNCSIRDMPKVPVTCQECGKEFEVKQSTVNKGRGRFCSRICYGKWRSKYLVGEKSPAFRGGKIKLICQQCRKEFRVTLAKQNSKFCSQKCMGNWISINRRGEKSPAYRGGKIKTICQECRKNIELPAYRIKTGQDHYCSKECRYKAHSKKMSGENNVGYLEKIDRICKHCGKSFKVLESRLKCDPCNFCSKECQGKFQSQNNRGKNNPNFKNAMIARKCIICGKEFTKHRAWLKKKNVSADILGLYCSRKCFGMGHSIKVTGESSPNWQGGISFEPYCPKFNKEFKERVRAWFNYQCSNCEEPQNDKKHSVHHVYYNKKACCEQNENGEYIYNIDGEQVIVIGNPNKFVALCKSCHAKTNHNRVYWARYFEDIINNWYDGRSWID